MNKEQFARNITFLATAYNKEFTKEQLGVWYEFFKDTDDAQFRQAIKRIIPKEIFMPSIARVKKEIALLNNPLLELDAAAEWDKTLSTIKRLGRYNIEKLKDELQTFDYEIVRQVGIERILNSQDVQWERRMFIEIFNNSKGNTENLSLLSEPVKTEYELSQDKHLLECSYEEGD